MLHTLALPSFPFMCRAQPQSPTPRTPSPCSPLGQPSKCLTLKDSSCMHGCSKGIFLDICIHVSRAGISRCISCPLWPLLRPSLSFAQLTDITIHHWALSTKTQSDTLLSLPLNFLMHQQVPSPLPLQQLPNSSAIPLTPALPCPAVGASATTATFQNNPLDHVTHWLKPLAPFHDGHSGMHSCFIQKHSCPESHMVGPAQDPTHYPVPVTC